MLFGIAVAVVIALWWLLRGSPEPQVQRKASARNGTVVLDVGSFKRGQGAKLARAKQLAAKHSGRKHGAGSGLQTGTFVEDQCTLGPAELCRSLADMLADCDAGDGTTCLAIGQFLADTPPRAWIGIVFFLKACELGDRDACAYKTVLVASGSDAPSPSCDQDAYACSWRGYRDHDPVLLDEACDHGVADACAMVGFMGEQDSVDLAESRAYLERACQLGAPMACAGLADRLSAGCKQGGKVADELCYPPDQEEEKQARAVGCEAGWGAGCRYEPR